MDWVEWVRALFALLATLALIGLAFFAARRFGMIGGVRGGAERRLRVVESLMLDPRRKLLLVRCDDREHLLLVGPGGDRKLDTAPAKQESAP
jgi:flagellar protein FliO/FliZ